MKDLMGQELAVGNTVAFIPPTCTFIHHGTVTRLSGTMKVEIQYDLKARYPNWPHTQARVMAAGVVRVNIG